MRNYVGFFTNIKCFADVVNWMTNGILRLFGISAAQIDEHSMSKEELKTVLNESGALIPARHQSMLTSILDLEQVKRL